MISDKTDSTTRCPPTDVFILGAGSPARGQKPSALKDVALNTRAMDWQIRSFVQSTGCSNIHYLGGYNVGDVISKYPQVNYTIIPDWDKQSVLHTFLKAPFATNPVISSYSDTIFREEIIADMLSVNADVVFCIDSTWKERYASRSANDIEMAETVEIEYPDNSKTIVEFTGLVHFKSEVVENFHTLDQGNVGSSLIDLIHHLEKIGFSIEPYDVAGDWAELNSNSDVARFVLGTKADTLIRLEPLVRKSFIGKQVSFISSCWQNEQNSILDDISTSFNGAKLVVRSSSRAEDNWNFSNAGGFESRLDIDSNNKTEISDAINEVIASYGKEQNGDDQVLVQECISRVKSAGVVFTCGLETGAPFYRINFDDKSLSTESVTAGTHCDLRTIIVSRFNVEYLDNVEPAMVPVLEAVKELEQLLGFAKLDIEFAVDDKDVVHIFQIRPITVDHSNYEVEPETVKISMNDAIERFKTHQVPSPFVYGDGTLFANMSDWNPAEIVGVRPKPLALSLYRYLITNDVWARQRAEYGYRNVRPCPLILSFSGQPYVDVRASLNSFIPADLPDETAKRLASAYINILADNPQYHDKIEFDVAFTIWTPDFIENATARLLSYGVTRKDIEKMDAAFKRLTRNALKRLPDDIAPVKQLSRRREKIIKSHMSDIDKAFALLEDCRNYGTLAFSHAARAGFVATTLLKSFVSVGIFADDRRLSLLKSFSTVAGEFEQDKYASSIGKMSRDDLIKKYGHLRPGTYEISAQAYWEDPDCYLVSACNNAPENETAFELSPIEGANMQNMLDDLGASLSVHDMLTYLVEAIKAREFVKFEFTTNLSRALDICVRIGEELGIDRKDLSYMERYDLEQLKLNNISVIELKKCIEAQKRNHAVTHLIEFPSLIRSENDFFCFERFALQPNYVTSNKAIALLQIIKPDEQADLTGKIVLIPQADPGYDWLFGQGIAGLITKYGGANSHMAIRAAEIGLPAAIGVGEKLYENIGNMRYIELDCANNIIREIK